MIGLAPGVLGMLPTAMRHHLHSGRDWIEAAAAGTNTRMTDGAGSVV